MASSQAQTGAPHDERASGAPAETTEQSPARLHLAIGLLIGSAVIAALLVGLLARRSSSLLSPGKPVPGAGEVNALFTGVSEHGPAVGSPHAPVTLTEVADLQCPSCAGFMEKSLPTLVSRYVEQGELRIVFKPLDGEGPGSLSAARVAVAAGQQDRLWPFVDLMYRNEGSVNSGYVTSSYLRTLARAVDGLSAKAALAATSSAAVNATIARIAAEARRSGADSSPSFLISRTGGKAVGFEPTSSLDPSAFEGPIEHLLHTRG